jgi:protoporphyrinogen oxidase
MSARTSTAVVIGAGPAGLTAAFELLERTDIRPIVVEASAEIGGLSRTVVHAGNRMDLGGHRFFSKSDRVMRWWLRFHPLEAAAPAHFALAYRGQARELDGAGPGPDPDREDRVMLVRSRRSRILFGGRVYDYPLRLSLDTLSKLGLARTLRIGASYGRRVVQPRRPEVTLEDFFINRFGDELYRTFFRSYTEKVWGRSCTEIGAEWGAQRVKGLSVLRALRHALQRRERDGAGDLAQRGHETSLIERFLYPKLGPGSLWETVAAEVRARGGEVRLRQRLVGLETDGARVTAAVVEDARSGERVTLRADYVFSTMAVVDLVHALGPVVPEVVRGVADGLVYRDFITVGLLLPRLTLAGERDLTDNWIYIQEPGVHVGRLQIFNNWSPYMVRDPRTVWVGLEYFCSAGDALSSRSDAELYALAARELESIADVRAADVLDGVVVRAPKAYPAYYGAYARFGLIREWVDRFENLFLLGRNGMHRYNNQDHSVLTAMTAVDNLVAGVRDREAIWAVNTEQEYHEER